MKFSMCSKKTGLQIKLRTIQSFSYLPDGHALLQVLIKTNSQFFNRSEQKVIPYGLRGKPRLKIVKTAVEWYFHQS